jgi:hypothetical protein
MNKTPYLERLYFMRAYIACCIFLSPVILSADSVDPTFYLNGRIDPLNGRHKTFREALRLMNERNVQTIVETGTERWLEGINSFDGDGGSTIIFGHWATNNKVKMYSVDIDETHLSYSLMNTKDYLPSLTLVLSDSVSFLQNFPSKIDFLYLDSYDYSEENPGPPQQHCLNEIIAAEDKLTENSIVMIDDCNIPGGGKGALAIKYLLSKGWFLHRNHHQVILLRKRP